MKTLTAFILLLSSLQTKANSMNDKFYQLDYRERLSVDGEIPGLAGVEVTSSLEIRYRPKTKESETKALTKKYDRLNEERR